MKRQFFVEKMLRDLWYPNPHRLIFDVWTIIVEYAGCVECASCGQFRNWEFYMEPRIGYTDNNRGLIWCRSNSYRWDTCLTCRRDVGGEMRMFVDFTRAGECRLLPPCVQELLRATVPDLADRLSKESGLHAVSQKHWDRLFKLEPSCRETFMEGYQTLFDVPPAVLAQLKLTDSSDHGILYKGGMSRTHQFGLSRMPTSIRKAYVQRLQLAMPGRIWKGKKVTSKKLVELNAVRTWARSIVDYCSMYGYPLGKKERARLLRMAYAEALRPYHGRRAENQQVFRYVNGCLPAQAHAPSHLDALDAFAGPGR